MDSGCKFLFQLIGFIQDSLTKYKYIKNKSDNKHIRL